MAHRRPRKRRRPPVGPETAGAFPTANEIASRAHDLFVSEGRRINRIFEYWERAEQELLDRAARRALSRS